MNSYNIEQIEQITHTIHKTMNSNNDLAINIVDIAQQLGFTVYMSNFNQSNIDGMVINSKEEKSIYINQNNSKVRQRFTIAHELGHIILHHNIENEDYKEIDYRGNNKNYEPKEHEANIFAASLLMPEQKAIKLWHSIYDITKFSNFFKVSKIAATIRLQNLKLL